MRTLCRRLRSSASSYALQIRGRLRHADKPLLALQVPRTVRKNLDNGFRISRKDSSIEIDAVMAKVLGAYVAETAKAETVQFFSSLRRGDSDVSRNFVERAVVTDQVKGSAEDRAVERDQEIRKTSCLKTVRSRHS